MMLASSKTIRRERWIKLAYFLAVVLGLLFVIIKVDNMLVSMLLAFVFYYMLAPVVDLLEGRGFSRLWATSFPFIVGSIVILLASFAVFPLLLEQVQSIQANSEKYLNVTMASLQSLEHKINLHLKNIYPVDFKSQVEPHLMSMASSVFKQLPDFLSRSLTVLVMAPFLAFYMLLDGRDVIRKILDFVPNHLFELALNLNDQIGSQLGGFVRARFWETFIVGLITWLGFALMDFPYAITLGIVAGVLNIIPYVGPFLGAIPAVLISIANEGGTPQLIGIAVVFGVAQFVDHWILIPFLVAKIVNLHAVTVVVAVIAGAQAMGILGMIISIPVVSVMKVSLLAIYRHMIDFRES